MWQANPICFCWLRHCVRWAAALALASAGNSSAARMAIMAMTTSSSMSVKARRRAFTPQPNPDTLVSVFTAGLFSGILFENHPEEHRAVGFTNRHNKLVGRRRAGHIMPVEGEADARGIG